MDTAYGGDRMNDHFVWNGVDSRTYGVYASELPPTTIPAERTKQITVPGRPGSLTVVEGADIYDDLLLTAQCFVTNTDRFADIASWLRGSGSVMFPNRPGGHYRARIANQIPFEQILRGNPHRSFAVAFRCSPFWYLDQVADITLTTSGRMITNPGSVYAEPVITVYGSGDITLMVGVSLCQLTDVTSSITLDCELKEAFKGNALQNDHMSGEFPVLKPGSSAISWSGNVSSVVISPRWRSI